MKKLFFFITFVFIVTSLSAQIGWKSWYFRDSTNQQFQRPVPQNTFVWLQDSSKLYRLDSVFQSTDSMATVFTTSKYTPILHLPGYYVDTLTNQNIHGYKTFHDSTTFLDQIRLDSILTINDSLYVLYASEFDSTVTISDSLYVYGHVRLDSVLTVNDSVWLADDLVLDNLTANRLLALDANKQVENTDISSWLDGTANEVAVTDDGDGTATLDLPDSISTSEATADSMYAHGYYGRSDFDVGRSGEDVNIGADTLEGEPIWKGNLNTVLGAVDKVYINGLSTEHTDTDGVLDIDYTPTNGATGVVGVDLNLTAPSNGIGNTTHYGLNINYNGDSDDNAGGIVQLIQVGADKNTSPATTYGIYCNETSSEVDYFIFGDNTAPSRFDAPVYFYNNANAAQFGDDASDTDIVLNFKANTSDGTITYMEDEDRFDFDNIIALAADGSTEATYDIINENELTNEYLLDGATTGQIIYWNNTLSRYDTISRDVIYYDSTDNRFGMGTTNPQVKFDIRQTVDGEGVRIYGYDDKSAYYGDIYINSAGDFIINASGESGCEGRFTRGGTTTMRWDDSEVNMLDDKIFSYGNNKDFNERYDETTNDRYEFRDKDNNYVFTITDQGSQFDINYNNGYVFFKNDGNIGIGTTDPDDLFSMSASTAIWTMWDSDVNFNSTTSSEQADSAALRGNCTGEPYFWWAATDGDNWQLGINTDDQALFENATLYEFDNDVDVSGKMTAEKYVSDTITIDNAATDNDNVDVSSLSVLFIDTSNGNVTIGGFSGGVVGQILHIAITDATNNTVLEDDEGTGNQDIKTSTGGDITITNEGGTTLVFDGTYWRMIGIAQ